MKKHVYLIGLWACSLHISCEKFVEVEVPDNRISSEVVFTKDATATSAVIGIYNELSRAAFSSGLQGSITVLAELSADNLQTTVTNANLLEYEENELGTQNTNNLNIWSSMYNIIYMANAVIEGLSHYNGVSDEQKEILTGEAHFIRAFTYFYLVNLYQDVPLVLTTDYRANTLAARTDAIAVYDQIIVDLEYAIEVLGSDIREGERLRANKLAATALLARVHLHLQNWERAVELSSTVIAASQTYTLLGNLDAVFLANSEEAIWQISPVGNGGARTNTNEGDFFILLTNSGTVSLKEEFMATFAADDARREHWVGLFQSANERYYYPFKYKIKNTAEEVPEYSMVLRLAEQYLIRAEARARQGSLSEAIADLDKIRARANLDLMGTDHPNITQGPLLDSILTERRRELFAEWGHRWLDLKRMGQADAVLGPKKTLWQQTDVFYPIPEDELRKNPNMSQNFGY